MQKRNGSSSPTQQPRISLEAQYREVYESRRQHDRFIWQTPAIVVVVDGALMVTTFAFVHYWLIREFIIAFALIMTAVLTFALIKHRYFIDLEEDTLQALEDECADKRIQRMTEPTKGKVYWAKAETPNWLQKKSAHRVFRWGMYLICSILFALLFVNPLLIGDTIPPI